VISAPNAFRVLIGKEAWDDFKSTLVSGIASIVDQQKRELINTDTQCAFLDAEIYGKIL